jgi:DNA-binding MarR family transcriptional regulator
MSVDFKLLNEVMTYLEKFQDERGGGDLKEFTIFLQDKVFLQGNVSINRPEEKNQFMEFKSYPEVEFSTLLTGLFRFAKHYVKKAFINASFNTLDEFGFLASLLREGDLLKNELINRHLLEISSGSEIIKRLVKNGLIVEYRDDKDKRARRVSLSDKGRMEIFTAFEEMHKVSEIIVGDLSDKELQNCLIAFNKLVYFHNKIHENDKNSDLNHLHESYVVKK